MLRALSAGIAGLKGQQTRLDVIGNNIANANTVGFRAGQVSFKELFSQTLSAGSAATATLGGQNPAQVGLGMQVGSIDVSTAVGSQENTGRSSDLAIQGSGFFVLKDGVGGLLYSRAGHFDWDAQGYLVNPGTGQRVQGWAATGGTFGPQNLGTLTDVHIANGAMAARATTNVTFGSNLDAGAAVGATYNTSATVFDSQGKSWSLQFTFRKTATNTWDWAVTDPTGTGYLGTGPANDGAAPPPLAPATGQVTFDTSGVLNTSSPDGTVSFTPPGAAALNLKVNFSALTQLAAPVGSTATVSSQDGLGTGLGTNVTIDTSGVVRQVFSNGTSQAVAQIALASFPNPGGLIRAGDTNFTTSNASGLVQVAPPGQGSQGTLSTGVLEQSNVDLSQEFSDLIVTQRAFQADTRVITTADEVLQDLVNLRH